MRWILLFTALFLISALPVRGQEDAVSEPTEMDEVLVEKSENREEIAGEATISGDAEMEATEATELATEAAETPSESEEESKEEDSESAKPGWTAFFDSETNRAATLFTLAVVLILVGFLAGRHSNGYSDESESEE